MAKTQTNKTPTPKTQHIEKNTADNIVKKGDKVKIHYTGSFTDGKVFDSSDGRAPLQFEVGAGEVIPGFEQAVNGMKLNEEKKFDIPAKEGYGEIRAELMQEVPRKALPEKPEPQLGMQLVMQAPDGRKIIATITKINADKITLDLNHPLAGKDLQFKVKVVGINEPEETSTEEEHTCSDCSDCGGGCH